MAKRMLGPSNDLRPPPTDVVEGPFVIATTLRSQTHLSFRLECRSCAMTDASGSDGRCSGSSSSGWRQEKGLSAPWTWHAARITVEVVAVPKSALCRKRQAHLLAHRWGTLRPKSGFAPMPNRQSDCSPSPCIAVKLRESGGKHVGSCSEGLLAGFDHGVKFRRNSPGPTSACSQLRG